VKHRVLPVLIAFLVAAISPDSTLKSAVALAPLTISYIDVGQGDSILLRDPDGFDVLIDGGPTSAGSTIVNYLRNQAVDDIDVMLVTHPDADHIGGLIQVLGMADVPVEQVLYSGYPGDTATWTDFTHAVTDEGLSLTTAQYPQTLTWGSVSARVLSPTAGLTNPATNAASVVVMVTYGSNQFLFTGDISSAEEADIIGRGSNVNADILKVAHHGSGYSSSAVFLESVGMNEAVISVGQDNPYGHPDPEAISRLLTAGATIFRTDFNGTVVVVSDGSTYTITPTFDMPNSVYLPIVMKSEPQSTFTGLVTITNIFYDGEGTNEPNEYVEIRNDDTGSIQLAGWSLRDAANHVYTFPPFAMEPNQVCRIYTNEYHPEWCGFNYGSGTAIWNNTGDSAFLKDGFGTQIDQYTY